MSINRPVVIETIALTKIFKDFWGRDKVVAVNDLNLQIYQGEVFGLLGPNGSGKTTTIKMLLGLLYPTKGRAKIFGKSPQDVEVKSRIGYLPEETRLYRFLDSWETLDFYGRLFSLDSSERMKRSESLLEMVGLSPAADRPIGQYSKGMARRIGLAQSLINDPDLLILDEPTSGMDPIGTRQIKDLLLELKKRGKTILLSSHLLADVEDVCDRIGIMYGGKMLCCGTIDELLTQQDEMQIVLDRLDEEKLNRLKEYIQKEFGVDVLSVSPPRKRLEPFFLSMVEQAQEKFTTHGSLAGGKVSEFLKASEDVSGKELLDKLVKEEPEVESEEKSEEEDDLRSGKGQAEQKVLEELLSKSEDNERADKKKIEDNIKEDDVKDDEISRTDGIERIEKRQSKDEIDRDVLNKLIGGEENEDASQQGGK